MEQEFKVGNTIMFKNYLMNGVIVKKHNIPWGFNLVVQLVNVMGTTKALYDRGELIEVRPEDILLLDKILPI